jgi:hypothetical protein
MAGKKYNALKRKGIAPFAPLRTAPRKSLIRS